MSADELRQAAATLRERATKATVGPWSHERRFGRVPAAILHGPPGAIRGQGRDLPVSEDLFGRDASYIATVHPGVGLVLARVLDNAADAFEHADLYMDCFHPTCLTVGELIPLARLINGDES